MHAHESCWRVIISVGLGSALFHATLSVAGQVLDELPICLLLIVAVLMATPRSHWRSAELRSAFFSLSFFALTTPALTVCCVLNPVLSHIVCVLSAPTAIAFFLRLYFGVALPRRPRRTVRIALVLVAFAIGCWIADRVGCSDLQAAMGFNPQLHAVWHVCMAGVVWATIILGLHIRAIGDGFSPRVARDGVIGLPFVVVDGKAE